MVASVSLRMKRKKESECPVEDNKYFVPLIAGIMIFAFVAQPSGFVWITALIVALLARFVAPILFTYFW